MHTLLQSFRLALTLSPLTLIVVFVWLGSHATADAGPAEPTPATVHYVANSGTDSGTCNVNNFPCRTIQFAVDKAASSDTILVAQGVYTQTNVRLRDDIVASGSVTQVVYISKTITIQGGYTTTDNFVSHLPLTQLTTIDAQNKGRGVYIASGGTGRLFDLHLTHGSAANMGGGANTGEDAGGGLYAYGGGLLLTGATIFSNTADAGGGVYLNNMTVVLATTSAIVTNTAAISGGGVYIKDSPSVVWSTSDFSANSATKRGGGISAENSAIQVSASTINRNSAGQTGGGGIRLLFSDGASVSGNTIMQNNTGVGNAGAIFLERSDASVSGNIMISNTAGAGGAMYVFFSNGATLSGNVIRGNTSNGDGGGIVLQSTVIKLINNVIVDNHLTSSTTKGSGIFVQQSAARLLHNTIARNTGGDNSGLSFSTLVPAAPIVMTNTVIVNQSVGITTTAGNTVTVRGVLFFGNGTDTSGAGPINITNSHNGNPLFMPDGYHISSGSGAIDNGINAFVTTDIDGDTRPFGSAPDLGADEFVPQPDVAILKIGPSLIISPSNALSSVPYRIVLTNVGNITLTSIVVTDTLPSGMQADSTVNQTCFPLVQGAKCTVASLSVGATKVFTIFASVNTPPACGTLMTNQVVAAPSEGDVNPADNTETTQALFSCPRSLFLPLILR